MTDTLPIWISNVRWVAALAVVLGACADDGGTEVGRSFGPIVYGEPEHDEEGTVYIESYTSACSGSLIAPTVILTANHCVEGTRASDWRVHLGQNPALTSAVVTEIVRPGPFTEYSLDDLAMLVLASPLELPQYIAAATLESDVDGSEVKIVGYGTTETGGSGRRLSATMEIFSVEDLWFQMWGTSYPGPGDSGGPVIDERGEVIGVISRGGDGYCAATRVDAFRALLDPVIRREGGCVQGDPEVCDGFDNNCDREIDEGCTAPGEPCETAEECPTGLCEEVEGVAICTSPCTIDDMEPCWDGAYCLETSCGEGWCRLGTPGEGELGDECDDDRDCEGLMCRDPGDGRTRCTERCEPDAAECGAGRGCASLGDGCGGCFSLEDATWPRGLGEDCDEDSDCRGGACLTDLGVDTCTRACGAGEPPCPDLMHCRDERCVPGPPAELGERCLSDEDCEEGLCWLENPTGPVCTEECGEVHTQCFARASCDFDLALCVPWDSMLGGPCEPDGDPRCVEGDCVEVEGEEPICARPCSEGCPSGFECREDGVDEPLCWPATPAPPEEGCDCASARARPSPTALLRLLSSVLPF